MKLFFVDFSFHNLCYFRWDKIDVYTRNRHFTRTKLVACCSIIFIGFLISSKSIKTHTHTHSHCVRHKCKLMWKYFTIICYWPLVVFQELRWCTWCVSLIWIWNNLILHFNSFGENIKRAFTKASLQLKVETWHRHKPINRIATYDVTKNPICTTMYQQSIELNWMTQRTNKIINNYVWRTYHECEQNSFQIYAYRKNRWSGKNNIQSIIENHIAFSFSSLMCFLVKILLDKTYTPIFSEENACLTLFSSCM